MTHTKTQEMLGAVTPEPRDSIRNCLAQGGVLLDTLRENLNSQEEQLQRLVGFEVLPHEDIEVTTATSELGRLVEQQEELKRQLERVHRISLALENL